MKKSYEFVFTLLLVVAMSAFNLSYGQSVFSPEDLLGLERCSIHQLSPDGTELIYSVTTPRGANEKPGPAHKKYFIMKLSTKESSPLFKENIKGSSPQYSPDGSFIAFTYKKKKDPKQVWVIPAAGGDMLQLTNAANDVNFFRWQPDGQGIAYLSPTPKSNKELELKSGVITLSIMRRI